MQKQYSFDEVARLPAPGDNVAIVTRNLDANTEIYFDGQRFALSLMCK